MLRLVICRSFSSRSFNVNQLYHDLVLGRRIALSKAITLVESTKPEHHKQAQKLLSLLLLKNKLNSTSSNSCAGTNFSSPVTVSPRDNVPSHNKPVDSFATDSTRTFRIGLSGAPGVGKSSFIESFGIFLLEQGNKVAVLAVDPSSSKTGGSILGDKTRMTELSKSEHAYVRPSPSRGTLGGVARNTNEAILICEAAGYNIVLVETVGVGQSETMVADMVDMFVLLVAPGTGDELQGMKKGIVELSDLIVVNKADGELSSSARVTQLEYISALKFLKPSQELWKPSVLPCSSIEKRGLADIWNCMKSYHELMCRENLLLEKRGYQQRKWMWSTIMDDLISRIKNDADVKKKIEELEMSVMEGAVTSGQAADIIIQRILKRQMKS